MDKIKLKVGDRVRVIRADQAEAFFHRGSLHLKKKRFVEAYLTGNMRNSGKAYRRVSTLGGMATGEAS